MAVITKVSTQKRKGYFNIFLDNQFAFGVSEKILTEYRLFKGTELTDEQIEEIKQRDENTLYLIKKKDLRLNWQTPLDVITYIRENLELVGQINIYEIYK